MSREIKFRAYLKNEHKVVEVSEFDIEGQWLLYRNQTIEKVYRFKDLELSQFTGRKDAVGKDIYEGDIALVHLFDGDEIMTVVWSEEFNGWRYKDDSGNEWNIDTKTRIIVLGNIYLNSDLLTEV